MDAATRLKQPPPEAPVEPGFFISYCRDDVAYVARLTAYLREFGIPFWHDRNMAWGVDRFPAEIRRRLTRALAVIVVMSPQSEASRWVELEVLEGQRHDREFFPILLAGERFFLLASTSYVDARDGRLPTGRELAQLQRINDARARGAGEAPPVVLPAAPQRPPAPRATKPDGAVMRLREFLECGEVEHADILTTSILLKAAGRLDHGWMRRTDGRTLPFELLDGIDAAWAEHSRGSQGFRAQLELHDCPPPRAPAGHYRDFTMLEVALGWKQDQRATTPRYGKFVRPSGCPGGFFPTLRNPQLERFDGWHDPWLATVMAVHLQVRRWGGRT